MDINAILKALPISGIESQWLALVGLLVEKGVNELLKPKSELLKRIAAEREARAREAARKLGGARKRVRRALSGSRPPA